MENFFNVFLLCFLGFLANINAYLFNISTISYGEGFSTLFSDFNIVRSPDGRDVSLLLNRFSGSGFISSKMYKYGIFSANIKLPGNYTAGICVAFYASNNDVFVENHDEIDFEFLGNLKGKPWRFQTNFYGNGTMSRGREERYTLWFDPSEEFHRYSILWTPYNIVYYIDDIPIREVIKNKEMGGDYPSKPMQLYATIWDASDWATGGGKFKANYKYAPFVSEFKDLALDGCPVDPLDEFPTPCSLEKVLNKDYSRLTLRERSVMREFRKKYMYYSYCYDTMRYPLVLPDCIIDLSERARFNETGRLKLGGIRGVRRGQSRRRSRDAFEQEM